MTKLTIGIIATAVIGTGLSAVPAPVLAQTSPQSEIVVYGTDPCPRATEDKIVICKRRPETERYRIAPDLRPSGTRQQTESWAQKSQPLTTVGATGIGSCSPVGPAGYTGCLIQSIKEARGERKQTADQQTPPQ